MPAKIDAIIMSSQRDAGGNLTVRIVGQADDGTFPYGDVTSQLSQGDKAALNAIINKIIRSLEGGNK